MVIFQSLSWRNFLSTGNDETSVQLNKSPTTLVVGANGAGKSTMLDALSFALFGKPHRNIKKQQLVNSINNKKCLTTVEFSVGNSNFKVVRGIKPNVFEIWQNGNQINQDSNARDFQKYLEANILKLNHKSFHQIVVLGSSSFIPFMQLSSNHRREVIEDLLDINIFSRMNGALKERMSKVREELKDLTYNVDMYKEKIKLQQKYIKDITELNNGIVKEKTDQIEILRADIAMVQSENISLSEYVTEHEDIARSKLTIASSKESQLIELRASINNKVKHLTKEAKFFEDNEHCPTCDQSIADHVRDDKLDKAKAKAKELMDGLQQLQAEADLARGTMLDLQKQVEIVHSKQHTIHTNNQLIDRYQKDYNILNQSILQLTSNTGDITLASNELEIMHSSKEDLLERKLKLAERQSYYTAISEMLKDTGIKTKIIKQYLPVMNKMINQYLQVLDFFISFHIDENFNEIIKSRHRDDFNYASFSEGEKQRIDLALLFTWRQISKLKNSSSTNLLILDETFDSSLDNDGIDNLMKILDTLDNGTNVFIISHKGDVLENKFRSKIEFTKEHNFSMIK